MKYKLKDESLSNMVRFEMIILNIPLIQVLLDEERSGIVIQPSQEIVNLVNEYCVGGEPDTFKNAMTNMIQRLKFNIDDFTYQPITNWEHIKYTILDRFSLCEKAYNIIQGFNHRYKFIEDLFDVDSKLHRNIQIYMELN